MPIHAATTIDPHRVFGLHSIFDREAYRLETGASGVTVSNEFSGRLSVRMAEGDTITLTATLEADVRAGRYDVRGGSGQAEISLGAESARYGLQRDFGITVEGDLNEQELNDFHKLLQNISNIFRGFVEGQDEKALAQAAILAERFRGLATLSSLDVSVEAIRSITVVAASTYTPGGAPATAAAIPQLSNGTTAPTPSSDSPEDGHLALPKKDTPLASLIQHVFDALKEAETELQKFQTYVSDFFETLREDLVEKLEAAAKPKEEEEHVHPVERTRSAMSNGSVSTAYGSVNLDTVSFSIQG